MAPKTALCLYGRFDNRYAKGAGQDGFDYIQDRILLLGDVHVFIFSFDQGNEPQILALYGPWIKSATFVASVDFDATLTKHGVDVTSLRPPSQDRPLEGTLAFFYQRDMALRKCLIFAEENGEHYEKVVVSRFDLGQIDKHNGIQPFRVSEIGPLASLDTNSGAYVAAWNQFNEGLPDQWMVLSLKDAALFSGSFDRLIQNLTPKSEYFRWIESGIQDSDETNAFSNEVWSLKDHANSSVRSVSRSLDNHLLLKYDFISTGLYSRLLPCFDSQGIASLTFSHTSYADALKVGLGQRVRHLGPFEQDYLALEKPLPKDHDLPLGLKLALYDEALPYTGRLLQVLAQLTEEYVLFTHEDMPITQTPATSAIFDALRILKARPSNACVRLIRVGRSHLPGFLLKLFKWNFIRIPRWSKWQFSIQPTLWKRERLMAMLRSAGDQNIWDLEVHGQSSFRNLGLRGYQPATTGRKRGKHHGDSLIYPYVATAIVKGKWNISEYPELRQLTAAYDIDSQERGER